MWPVPISGRQVQGEALQKSSLTRGSLRSLGDWCCLPELHFGSLLGTTERRRAPRYGPMPPSAAPYPSESIHFSWRERAHQLNVYLLDGCLADGSACGYKRAARYPAEDSAHLSKFDVVDLVVREAYTARVNQYFEDGNHRTAILSIYEKLADKGWLLKADPFDLYIILSNRQQEDDARAKLQLAAAVLRKLAWQPNISLEQRAAYALRVKAIASINSLCEDGASHPPQCVIRQRDQAH